MEIVVDRERWRPAEIPALIGDNKRIARDLGWRPEIPFRKTLSDVLDYWRGRVAAGRNA
jgi:GDP-4-dehydro-6-deoxy-D-mannose reductase